MKLKLIITLGYQYLLFLSFNWFVLSDNSAKSDLLANIKSVDVLSHAARYDAAEWEVKLTLAITSEEGNFSDLFQRSEEYEVCIEFLLHESKRWCQFVETQEISTSFRVLESPIVWLQISVNTLHADRYLFFGRYMYGSLDLRIPNGGISLYSSNHLLSQLFSLLPRLNLLPDSVTYTLPVATRYSYNYEISAMCERYNMSAPSCCDLFSQLNSWLYKLQLIETLSLPTIQILPTPSQPFVFLHIPKTAGKRIKL